MPEHPGTQAPKHSESAGVPGCRGAWTPRDLVAKVSEAGYKTAAAAAAYGLNQRSLYGRLRFADPRASKVIAALPAKAAAYT